MLARLLVYLFLALASQAVYAQPQSGGSPGPGPAPIVGNSGNAVSIQLNGVAGDSGTLVPSAIYCNFIGIPNGSSPAGSVQISPWCAPITISRASIATTGLFTDAAGSTYTTCAVNVPCFEPAGLMNFHGATNYLLSSDTPATQTTASLAAGTYSLWVIGTGTATPSAGTITGCTGFAATSAGTPTSFTCTGPGTVTVTVSGSLTRFQLENNTFATSYCPSGASVPCVRQPDVILMNIVGTFPITMAVAYIPMGAGTADTQTPLQIDEGDNNSRMDLDLGAGQGQVGCAMTVATVPQGVGFAKGNLSWATGVLGKMAFQISPNGSSACVYNGQTPGTLTGALTFTPSRIQIGSGSNTNHQCNCIISVLNVWWQALPLTYFQNITK